MRSRVATPASAPVNSEASATTTFVILLAGIFIWFATPHYFTMSIFGLGPLQIGEWQAEERDAEPWQIGDYGQLRHLRYVDGTTCTQIITGPFVFQLCR